MERRWGKRFGLYEVAAELGRGAMGIVYKARDPRIDRFVAIKTICLVGHVQEEQKVYRERFFQEAQAAGRLIHPNIVTIFDVGEDPETFDPYIVMEYVAGVPLERYARGREATSARHRDALDTAGCGSPRLRTRARHRSSTSSLPTSW